MGQTASATVVPAAAEAQAKGFLGQIGAPALGLLPVHLPSHYAYESFSVTGSPASLDVSFADGRFIATPSETRLHEISFDTSYAHGSATSCSKGSRATVRVSGVLLYSRSGEVWRCIVAARGGAVIKVSASGRIPAATLALLLVSVRPFSTAG